ncbi:ketoisovalerate reductase [Xylaria venustula]|nr:ketoisovalerate reductase [Xylaria venustula]
MRATRLSTTLASTIGYPFIGAHRVSSRFLHSTARMRGVGSPREIPAEWLRRIIEDDAQPPKLYAWTPENLSPRGELESESVHGSKPGINGSRSSDENESRRVYILGVGNIGRLYAMCLSELTSRPPITLVVHRKELLERWISEPGIELTRYGHVHKSAAFDIEWWTDVAPACGGRTAEVAGGGRIANLIIATKASDAIVQVDKVRRYLSSKSTVAFAQNGMCKLWPPLGDAYVRARFPDGTQPSFVACVTTHGVTSQGPFKSTHASPANALVGPVMANSADGMDGEQMRYLMRLVADAPDLDAREVSRKELWVAQLEKLVVNAIINPLTAILRCKNGELFVTRNDAMPAVIDKLLSEASEILCALISDSTTDEILVSGSVDYSVDYSENSAAECLLANRRQLLERFVFARLRAMVLGVGAKVSANTSSMLQDVQADKLTEIDDFNGWLVETARLLGKEVHLPTHEKLIKLVKDKATLTRAELCATLLV